MHPLKSLRVALIVLLVLPFSLGFAEDKAPKSRSNDGNIFTIDFPGGPLSQLVASFGTQDPKLSIVQSEGLDPILPAFAVHNVRLDSVIAALGLILERQGYLLASVGPNIAVLTRLERPHAGQAFASFQIQAKLGDRSVEEFIAAIQAACEFAHPDQKASTLRFKYHPGTKLLFVAGTEQEVDVAHRVFGSLPDSPAKTPPPPPEKK